MHFFQENKCEFCNDRFRSEASLKMHRFICRKKNAQKLPKSPKPPAQKSPKSYPKSPKSQPKSPKPLLLSPKAKLASPSPMHQLSPKQPVIAEISTPTSTPAPIPKLKITSPVFSSLPEKVEPPTGKIAQDFAPLEIQHRPPEIGIKLKLPKPTASPESAEKLRKNRKKKKRSSISRVPNSESSSDEEVDRHGHDDVHRYGTLVALYLSFALDC